MPARERERERSKSHSWFELLFVLHTQHTQGRSCVVWWGWVLGAWLMADGCAYVYACVQGWLSLPSALLCPGRCRWPWSVWLAHSIAISTFTFSSQPVCLSLVPPACLPRSAVPLPPTPPPPHPPTRGDIGHPVPPHRAGAPGSLPARVPVHLEGLKSRFPGSIFERKINQVRNEVNILTNC